MLLCFWHQSHYNDNYSSANGKSIDGVLGILTRDCKMVGADESTELWRPPNIMFFILHMLFWDYVVRTIFSYLDVIKRFRHYAALCYWAGVILLGFITYPLTDILILYCLPKIMLFWIILGWFHFVGRKLCYLAY